jgi:hypothetical protein
MTGVVVPFPPAYRQQIGEDDLDKVDRELASIDKELERVARARGTDAAASALVQRVLSNKGLTLR